MYHVIKTFEISADGKTLYFNASLDFELDLGETISITFDAEVVGCTDCGCDDCEGCEAWNKVWLLAGCQKPYYELYDEVQIIAIGNCPPSTPDIGGPTQGETGDELKFSFYSEDSDEDQVKYYIDWGDESEIYESEFMDQGVVLELTKVYEVKGVYTIKAKAVDEHGATYGWTYFGDDVTITEPDEEAPVAISLKRLGIGRVGATITNKADEDLTNVSWNLEFTKTGLFKGPLFGYDLQHNCTIATLGKGKSTTVYTGPMFFGGSIGLIKFGRGAGKITVKVDGEDYSKSFSGFVLSKLVIIL